MKLLYRTGVSFVSARLDIVRIPPVTASDLFGLASPVAEHKGGGLIVNGSYVPRTTLQRAHLLNHCTEHLQHFELDFEELLNAKDNNAALKKKHSGKP